MNRRVKKKIEKRRGYSTYLRYKNYLAIDVPIERALDEFRKANPDYQDYNNMIYLVKNKSKRHPKILKVYILKDVYPISTGFQDTAESGEGNDIEFQASYYGNPSLNELNEAARARYQEFMKHMLAWQQGEEE